MPAHVQFALLAECTTQAARPLLITKKVDPEDDPVSAKIGADVGHIKTMRALYHYQQQGI